MSESTSPGRPLIELDHITRDFRDEGGGRVRALDGVSLQIFPGEFVCVTGASGSGKSTLLNIIGCLDRATGGTYRFAGADIARLDDDGLSAMRLAGFGFVFQTFNLLEAATARQNVELPAAYTNVGGSSRDRAIELLDSLGVATRADHRPGELSGGEQQRLAIARALMNGARVILADEPTGALDSKQSEEIMALFKELSTRGHTVVVVSHDPAIAGQAARRVELQDGRIVADSNPAPGLGRLASVRPVGAANTIRGFQAAVRQSITSLRGGALRSLLSTLSIALGIAFVSTALGLAQGAYVAMRQSIGQLGADWIQVSPSPPYVYDEKSGLREADTEPVHLTVADARAIEDLASVRTTVPSLYRQAKIQHGTSQFEAGVVAEATDALPQFMYEEWSVEQGSFLSDRDNQDRTHVAVIGPGLRDRLFRQGIDPLGETILIDGVPFVVKGVLAPHPIMAGPNYTPEQAALMSVFVHVPFGTAETLLFPPDARLSIEVLSRKPGQVEGTANDIRDLLIRRHGREGFNLHMHHVLLDSARRTARQGYPVLGGIGAVALIVSGLGVMAVMLASVSQRTREIGIRRAVGARRRDIVRQFLVEAGMIALVGGALGALLGFAAGPVVGAAFDMPTAFAPWFWPVAVGLAVATGLASGILPALRAARLDPTRALAG